MKEIKAIIRPFRLQEVTEELHKIDGLPGVTVSEIRGFGKSKAKNTYDNIEYEMAELIPLIKLEVVVNDEMVDQVLNVIQRVAHTGNTGDGKIFVLSVDETVKIRTNERGRGAI